MRPIISPLVFVLVTVQCSSANDGPIAAIRQRAAEFPTLDLRIHVVETVEKGARLNGPRVVSPSRDLTWESDNRWALDGAKYRYERNHPLDNSYGGKSPAQIHMTGDGRTHKSFHVLDQSRDKVGTIEAGPNGLPYSDWYFKALAIHFRGSDARSLGCHLPQLKLVAKGRPVNGLACDEYAFTSSDSSVTTYWFDPARRFVLVRMHAQALGKPSHRLDVDYAERPTFGLVPSKWTVTEFRTDGAVRGTSVVTLLEASRTVPNPTATFDITFPNRSTVYDGRAGDRKYRVNDLGQLIELDILGQPVGSTVVPVLVRIWFAKLRGGFLAGSLLGIAAMLGFCWMRWRRSRSTVRRSTPTAELPFV